MSVIINGSAGVTTNSGAVYNGIASGTAVASTSGTSIDFTSIPSWVKRITVSLAGVSSNGGSNFQIQLGTGGTATTSGYLGASDNQASGGGTSTAFTTGLGLCRTSGATFLFQGIATFVNITGNTWVGSWVGSTTGTVSVAFGSTYIALGGALNMVRITTVNGTDAFDAGSVNILYE